MPSKLKIRTLSKGVFDRLKNEGQNMTIPIVECLVCKIILGTRQNGGKRHEKTEILVFH